MAAEIHSKPLTRKPVLLNKVEGSQDVVNMAVIVPKEDGVISVSEDRTVRVWMKRDSGQYWPSIFHAMPAPCSCMSFNPETRRLSIGLDNGTISEFILSEDYNKMTPTRTYQAHQSRLTMVLFVLEMEWMLSTGQDKLFTWHCSETGERLGNYRTTACASCLQFDVETKHVFVGDHSGQVTILKLEQDNCSLITTFKGHTAGVTTLCWDPVQRLLFSGSSDHSIIMWDIGGRKGTALELQGHNDKIQHISYAHHSKQLISCSADGSIVVWNMDVERQETPEWLDSDSCQKCDHPFFWNFKQMWDSKKIGLRQVCVYQTGWELARLVCNMFIYLIYCHFCLVQFLCLGFPTGCRRVHCMRGDIMCTRAVSLANLHLHEQPYSQIPELECTFHAFEVYVMNLDKVI